MLESALQKRQGLAQPDEIDVAKSLIALSLLRSEQQQSKDARRLAREAVAMIESHHSEDRFLLAKATSALGQVLLESGNYQESQKVLEQASALLSELNASSPEMAINLTDLAATHLYLGEYKVAAEMNRRALVIDQNVYGDHHPHVADDLANLAES